MTRHVDCAAGLSWDEKQDIKQRIRLELLKCYINRWKYTTYDNVVRSMVQRRIKDFQKAIWRERNRVKVETDLYRDDEEDKEFTEPVEAHQHDLLAIDRIKDFHVRATEGDLKHSFTDWEKECLDSLMFLYDEDCSMDLDDIIELAGEETSDKRVRATFSVKFSKFREKMQGYKEEIGIGEL